MGAAVDVIDRRRDVEPAHDRVVLYAAIAWAWTSLTERFFAAASFAQSSNSGTAFNTRPSRRAILIVTVDTPVGAVRFKIARRDGIQHAAVASSDLESDGPDRSVDGDDLPVQALARNL